MRKLVFLLSALVALAFGCSSKAPTPAPAAKPTTSATSGAPATAATPKAGNTTWEDSVLAAAKKEGVATTYSFALAGDAADAVAKAFQAKYGVKLDVISGTSPALLERVKAEYRAKQYLADLVDMSSTRILELKNAGMTQSVKDLPSIQNKASWYTSPLDTDPDGHMMSYYATAITPYINTTMVKAGNEPQSWLDFLQPQWKGKVMIGDPGVYAGTTYFYYALVLKTKQLNDDYFRQLGSQIGVFVPGGAAEQVQALVRGDGPVNLSASSSGAGALISQGAPIKALTMKEGSMVNPSTISAMLSNAPHPNASRLFLNWFMSPDGLKVWAQAAAQSTYRKDVPEFLPPAARIDMNKAINLDLDDMNKINDMYNAGVATKLLKGAAGK